MKLGFWKLMNSRNVFQESKHAWKEINVTQKSKYYKCIGTQNIDGQILIQILIFTLILF